MNQRTFLMAGCIAATIALGSMAGQTPSTPAAKADNKASANAKTPWGDPDLQGTWTSDDTWGVPFERPTQFGTRATLTEDELKAREKAVTNSEEFVETGGTNHSPAKALLDAKEKGEAPPAAPQGTRFGRGVDAAPVPGHWGEFARRASHQTSQIVDPPDGRLPPLTPEAQAELDAKMKVRGEAIPASYTNWSYYDRCITRGVAGSILPVVYGNGLEIVQTPGYVAIRYEMVHDVRIIPTDGRPHLSSNIRSYMGDAVGHWEGKTLVVETTNLLGGRMAVGVNGETHRAVYARQRQHDQLRADRGRPQDLYCHLESRIPDYSRTWISALRIRVPRRKYGHAQHAERGEDGRQESRSQVSSGKQTETNRL